jgi:GH15 family glucan-1,4-alpha-glucosidase
MVLGLFGGRVPTRDACPDCLAMRTGGGRRRARRRPSRLHRFGRFRAGRARAADDLDERRQDGFGTALGRSSKVWFTLSHGQLTEVYFPRLDTPSTRDLELVVSDGRTFTERESTATTHVVGRVEGAGLTYRQPIVLAWQLGRSDARTYARVKRAADYIVAHGPHTKQERWENQSGWSPGTIASEIAGLVCAADLARRAGDASSAARYEAIADGWARSVQAWTATSNGPYAPRPYYPRLTKDRAPDRATTYGAGDSGPSKADQRAVVDPTFLELVRLGVKRADDPVIVNTVSIVDQVLGVQTPNGPFWHRFTFDGYGETRAGAPWGIGKPDTFKTFGRAWPIFAGERGEYELASGRPAGVYLRAVANAANDGGMIPEQVWDGRPPTGRGPRFAPGEPTFSATPLAWSHAVFVRPGVVDRRRAASGAARGGGVPVHRRMRVGGRRASADA